jgi:hypothetical protein
MAENYRNTTLAWDRAFKRAYAREAFVRQFKRPMSLFPLEEGLPFYPTEPACIQLRKQLKN